MLRKQLMTIAAVSFAAVFVAADARSSEVSSRPKPRAHPHIFVTGSLIPQRVMDDRVVTVHGSALTIINRRRIDTSGRFTTAGILSTDPALHVRGY